jgi:hypothetical protein
MSRSSLRAILLALLVAYGLGAPTRAVAQTIVRVSGTVTNASLGGAAAAQLDVELESLQSGSVSVLATTSIDSAGRFFFDGVQPRSGVSYRASVSFLGVRYHSQSSALSADEDNLANITVYNATEDPAALHVERVSIVLAGVDRVHRLLNFVESDRFINDGQESYVGRTVAGQRESLRFSLDAGSSSLVGLEGLSDQDVIPKPVGFALSIPVPPGETTVAFGYDLPFSGSTANLQRTLAYPTALIQLLLPDGISVSSPQLATQGSLTLGSRTLRTLEASNLPAGTEIESTLTGLPRGAAAPLNEDVPPLWLQAVALLAVIVIVAGAAIVARRSAASNRSALLSARRRRLQAIVRLEERAEQGAIDSAQFARRRAQELERIGALDLLLRDAREESNDAATVGPP